MITIDKIWIDNESWDTLEKSLRPAARESIARTGHLKYRHSGQEWPYILITTFWKGTPGMTIMAIRGERPKDI